VSDLQMPSVLTSDGNHDTSRLSCFKDDYDLVGLGSSEIRVNEFVATALRRFHDRNIALGCSLFHPALESFGNVSQGMASYWVKLAIRIEETYNPLGLLERLNQAIEKNAVETAIVPMYAVPVVFVEGVHGLLPAAISAAGNWRFGAAA
jgi:hypothetical protein